MAGGRGGAFHQLAPVPGSRQAHALAGSGAEEQVAVALGVLEEVPQQGHVLAAVAFDLVDPPLLPGSGRAAS